MVDLSIVIVSWNTKELLRECLKSVYQYTSGITFEVFVVDNASSDGSTDMVRELFPQVHVIVNDYNAGFSKANNQAIRISKGRYVALLNPDTLLIEDVFSPLIKYADQHEHEKIGAIGPKILCKDGKTIQYVCARRLPNLYFDFCNLSGMKSKFYKMKIFSYRANCDYANRDYNSPRFVQLLSGACMVMKRKTIDNIGLMDENQFMYVDDVDWCKRVLDAGWKIHYYPKSSIVHYGGESSKQAKYSSNIEYEKAKYYYYVKHYGKSYALSYCVLLLLFSASKYTWYFLFKHQTSQIKEIMKIHKGKFKWALKKIGSSPK